MNLKGSLLRDDGQASIEWKAGIDGERTHFDLGFEQIPFSRGRPQSSGRTGGAERRLHAPRMIRSPVARPGVDIRLASAGGMRYESGSIPGTAFMGIGLLS